MEVMLQTTSKVCNFPVVYRGVKNTSFGVFAMFGGRGTYIYYVLVEEGKYDGVTWEVGWSR